MILMLPGENGVAVGSLLGLMIRASPSLVVV
jgi:hypothetical protein